MNTRLRLVLNIDCIHCFGCMNRINTKLKSLGADKINLDIITMIMRVDFIVKKLMTINLLKLLKNWVIKLKKL